MRNTQHLKEFAKYAALNVLGMAGLSCYILADTFFISNKLGTNGLTALNLAIPVYSIIHGCGLMLGMGGAVKYAILRSQGQKEAANICFSKTILLAFLFAFSFALTGFCFSDTLAKMLGANAEIFTMTKTYLNVLLLFSPAIILNDIFVCFIRNDNNPKLSMCAMLGGSFSNILLDYIFVFPLNMGIFGAVLATGLAPVISLAILSLHLVRRQNNFRLTKKIFGIKAAKNILLLGFPSLISEVSSGIVILVFNMILLHLQGNVGVAAYGVVANLSLVIIAIYTGIAQGVQPLVSKFYGSHSPKNCRLILRYALITAACGSCLIYLSIFLFAAPITHIFNSEDNFMLQQIAESGLKLYFTGAPFAGFNIIMSVFFTSTEKALPAHIVSLLRGIILILPMAAFLPAAFGITGVWLAFPVTELLVSSAALLLYLISDKHFCSAPHTDLS